MPTKRTIHFKVETCVSVDVVNLAISLFLQNKCLVVLHKGKNENPHWHFQGETELDESEIKKKLAEVAQGHTKKVSNPNSRPVKRRKVDADDLGYQYMMKEDPPKVVYSRGFTEEELDELHEASKDHVEQLKNQLQYYLVDKIKWEEEDGKMINPKDLHPQFRRHAINYYMEEDKMPPPNLQKLILWYMLKMSKDKVVHRYMVNYVGKLM